MEKGNKGLGITLATAETNGAVDGGGFETPFVYIKKVVVGSVAEQSGRLKAGDRIVTVSFPPEFNRVIS